MINHQFTKPSKRSYPLEINCIRLPKYEKTFFNKTSGKRFERNDVEIMKYKRDRIITDFFKFYASNSKYTMIEIGFDFSLAEKTAHVLLKLRRQLKKIDINTLGYIWLVDKGDMGTMHFHLIVVIPKIDVKGKALPEELKINFNGKKVHSSFVRNKPRLKEYLLAKPIYFIGKRKRVFGRSRNFLLKVI